MKTKKENNMRVVKYLRQSVVEKDERKPCILLVAKVSHRRCQIILNDSALSLIFWYIRSQDLRDIYTRFLPSQSWHKYQCTLHEYNIHLPSMLFFKKHEPMVKMSVSILRASFTHHLLDLKSIVLLVDISLDEESLKNHYV